MPRSVLASALVLLVLFEATAFAQDRSRLDPTLRLPASLIVPGGEAPRPEPAAAPDTAAPGAFDAPIGRAPFGLPLGAHLADEPATAGPLVRALVRLGPGGEHALLEHGARIGARIGDIVTVRLPLDAIPALAADSTIRFVEAASRMIPETSRLAPPLTSAPVLTPGATWTDGSAPASAPKAARAALPDAELITDLGLTEIGAAGLWTRSGDRFLGLTGRGVVIGIVDTGLDLTHEDFLDPDGRTRVAFVWDQSGDGRPPGAAGDHSFDFGTECDREEINAGNCPLVDRAGHGTHVAGIAAGDGSATGNGLPAYRFAGVAPEAELIVVKAGDGAVTSDQLLEGVAYIFARAAELGRPAVVNLSVSTQSGPHDGTTLLEQGLDRLAGPGRLIVAGAGNSGVNENESPAFSRAPIHATARLAVGDSTTHSLVVPSYRPRPGAINDGAVLELWYDGRDSLTIAIEPPGGADSPVRVATGDSALVELPEGAVGVLNGVGGPQAINGDHVAMITIVDLEEGAPPLEGEWRITVVRDSGTGDGEHHLWLVGGTFDNPVELARLDGEGVTNSHVVGAPATADRVIAVAAHASRGEWRTLGGETRTFPFAEPVGDIAFFSSPGPRRDGVLKPEITAPGKMVVSARAAEAELWERLDWMVEEDGVHAANLGTSMAAPFVTGALAVLLQVDSALTPETARDLLARSARRDANTRTPSTGESPGTPNAQWGYGKLDVGAAVRILRPLADLEPEERVNISANPVRGPELVINYVSRPRRITVYDILGVPVRTFTPAEIGEVLTLWSLDNDAGRPVANGAFVLVVEFESDRVLRKLLVLRP